MNLDNSKARYEKAAEGIRSLRSSLKVMGGGGPLTDIVMEPVEESLKARAILSRDVTLAKVQAVLDTEALVFLSEGGDSEKREEARRFLSDHPELYIRSLTSRIVKELRALPVDTKLSKLAEEL